MVEVLSPGLAQNGHSSHSQDSAEHVASVARLLLATHLASKQEDTMMSREERHALMKEMNEHQALKDELNKKRGGWRTPRRGWSITDSPAASPTPAAAALFTTPNYREAEKPAPISPVPEQGEFPAKEMKNAPHPPQVRRPPLPPPRRSYSVMDYEPPPRTHRPSERMDILDLPVELHYAIFDYLDPIDSTCMGLTNSHFYDIHRRMFGFVPLSSHRNGPNDLEWAYRLSHPFIHHNESVAAQDPAHHLESMRVKGHVYCRKCGHYRCQLYRHLREWMGPDMEYCEVSKKFGRRAPEEAPDHCYIKSPKHPHRCGRHSRKAVNSHN